MNKCSMMDRISDIILTLLSDSLLKKYFYVTILTIIPNIIVSLYDYNI